MCVTEGDFCNVSSQLQKPNFLTYKSRQTNTSESYLYRYSKSKSKQNQTTKMLPLSLLRTAQNHPMLVELKNGETYNGHLVSCDNWMNINLREVICTSRDGDKFWRMPECYIRGSTIKYLRIPDEVIDMVKEETQVCFVFSLNLLSNMHISIHCITRRVCENLSLPLRINYLFIYQ